MCHITDIYPDGAETRILQLNQVNTTAAGALAPYATRAPSQYKEGLSRHRVSHYKDRRLWDCLIFIIIIPMLLRWHQYIDGLMQKRHNSIANAPELHLSCIKPLVLRHTPWLSAVLKLIFQCGYSCILCQWIPRTRSIFYMFSEQKFSMAMFILL